MNSPAPALSVVIPIYNEQENIEPLLKELDPVLAAIGTSFEIICVDDRSTDESLQVLERMRKERPHLRILRHTINCGESAAGATGFSAARGAVIVTMDADLQHDPADIPRFLAAMGPDVAAVCGVRARREDNGVKRLSSRIANWFRNAVTGDSISDAGCTLRAIRRDALAEMVVFNGMHRFLPTILRYQGYRVTEMTINHRPRIRGQSKYGINNRMWRGLRDCLAMRWYHQRCLPAHRAAPETPGAHA